MIKQNTQFKILKSNSGLTLVEVMVATGIAVIAGLAMTTLMQKFYKEQSEVSRKFEVFDLQRNLNWNLGLPNLCKCNMKGISLAGETISLKDLKLYDENCNLALGTTAPFVEVGRDISSQHPGFQVQRMELRDQVVLGPDLYAYDLHVDFSLSKPGLVPRGIVMKNLVFKTNATKQVIQCSTNGSDPTNASSCSDGMIFKGMNEDGSAICEPIQSYLASVIGQCPNGAVLKGFKGDGSKDCIPLPNGSNSPPPTYIDAGAICFSNEIDWLVQKYKDRGRCVDKMSYYYWLGQYRSFNSVGMPLDDIKTALGSALSAAFAAETQEALDEQCNDMRYTWRANTPPPAPSSQCVIKCSATNKTDNPKCWQ